MFFDLKIFRNTLSGVDPFKHLFTFYLIKWYLSWEGPFFWTSHDSIPGAWNYELCRKCCYDWDLFFMLKRKQFWFCHLSNYYRVSHIEVPFKLTLADRNIQVRFCLKVVLESWDWIFLDITTSFQKSSIEWPQQPQTEKIPKFNVIFHSTPKTFFSKH